MYDFTRMAGRYTHIYTCNMDIGNQLLESLDIPLEEPTVFVFKSAVSVRNGDIKMCIRDRFLKHSIFLIIKEQDDLKKKIFLSML